MIIGLTGQSGAGKTTLSGIFEKAGYFVINADLVAHEVSKEAQAKSVLKGTFGDIIMSGDEIDRKKLASVVFSDKAQLQRLNDAILPLICCRIREIISENPEKNILLDAPTLFESGLNIICDKTVAVICNFNILLKRIIARDFLTEEEAKKRLYSQKSDIFFKENCDIVIENNGSEADFLKKAQSLIASLKGA